MFYYLNIILYYIIAREDGELRGPAEGGSPRRPPCCIIL